MPSVDLEGAVSSLVGGSNPEGRSKYGSIVFYKQLKWATTHLNTSIQLGDNEEGIYVLTLAYSHPADYFRGNTGYHLPAEGEHRLRFRCRPV